MNHKKAAIVPGCGFARLLEFLGSNQKVYLDFCTVNMDSVVRAAFEKERAVRFERSAGGSGSTPGI